MPCIELQKEEKGKGEVRSVDVYITRTQSGGQSGQLYSELCILNNY
jgi:hypothetical protein